MRATLFLGLAAACAVYMFVAISLVPSISAGSSGQPRTPLVTAQTQQHEPTVVEFIGATGTADIAVAAPTTTEQQQTISCPSFSGPGYDRRRHPSRDISVPHLAAPYQGGVAGAMTASGAESTGGAGAPRRRLEPLPLSDVRLLPGSAFERAFATNLNFLKRVDIDALLLTWKLASGKRWPAGSLRLMGWEHTGSELRGHFLGHWLASAAMSYAATGDAGLGEAIADMVAGLAVCAKGHANGYLSAFPPSFLDRLEAITPVWAPYYTLHKLLAGLLHVSRLGRASASVSTPVAPSPRVQQAAESALRLASGLADYIDQRVRKLAESKSLNYHFETLNQECGGINDGLWQLAAATGEPRHARIASLFDKPCLFGPLAAGRDELAGMHGNTALALVIGAARRHELTGEDAFLRIASHFFLLVDGTRSYATGGSTHNELWGRPGELGHTLLPSAGGARYEHVESCTTHNMMRLVEMLLRSSGGASVRYAEWMERALLNGVLGTMRGEEPGAYLYFLPLGTFVSKKAPQAWRHAGWSTFAGDFWCCQGTGVEAFARLGETIFMQSQSRSQGGSQGGSESAGGAKSGPVPELYVSQLVPSELRWTLGGMRLRLEAVTPGAAHPDEPASLTLTVQAAPPAGSHASILIRVPSWAVRPTATLNLAPLAASGGASPGVDGAGGVANGSYVRVTRRWVAGDTIALTLPMRLSLDFLSDARPRYARLAALLHGPVVLACIGCKSMVPRVPPPSLLAMLKPVPRDAARQLRSLQRPTARGAPAGTVLVSDDLLWVREGEMPLPPFRHRRKGATDLDIAATFREVAGVAASEHNLVSFEPFGRPGCYVAAPAAAAAGGKSQRRPGAAVEGQVGLECGAPDRPLSPQQLRASSWKRHDPLVTTAHGAFQSYESLANPGLFLSTFGAPEAAAPPPRAASHAPAALGPLRPLVLARKPAAPPAAAGGAGAIDPNRPTAFGLLSSFEEAAGLAEYPAAAWWLRPPASSMPSALVFPLNEVVDEHYSTYYDFHPN